MSAPLFTRSLTHLNAGDERRADVDVARTEAVEKELDAFISKRHARRVKSEGERAAEEIWRQSVARYNERAREALLWERLHYHEALVKAHSATFELLIGRHKSEVERLERLLGIHDREATKGAA